MSSRCDQEMCPNWDGHSCPCSLFGIGPFEDRFDDDTDEMP